MMTPDCIIIKALSIIEILTRIRVRYTFSISLSIPLPSSLLPGFSFLEVVAVYGYYQILCSPLQLFDTVLNCDADFRPPEIHLASLVIEFIISEIVSVHRGGLKDGWIGLDSLGGILRLRISCLGL